MAIGSRHADYDASAASWSRARDVLAGEDAVKVAGEKYLPRLDSQSDEEYAAYKARASFFGATARTLAEYLDLVFRRAPVVAVGERKPLEQFVSDCDRWGMDFLRYARQVVGEVLSVGRGGSLVLADGGRPFVTWFRAEDILDWKVERVGGRVVLTRVVLKEGEKIRVISNQCSVVSGATQTGEQSVAPLPGPLPVGRGEGEAQVAAGAEPGSECVSEVWAVDGATERLISSETLKRGDSALSFIPFVFHGPKTSRPEPERLPLADIIAANLDHYRLDADFKHGLHFAALPTAWVSGFDKATPLRIGSSAAWVSDIPGASAGFLEFSGAGLAHIERAMEKVERRMALLGARMLEVAESDGEPKAGQRHELCGLGNVIASLNQSLTRVLQLACWWLEGGQVGDAAGVGFTMNTDLTAKAMSGESLTAVVAAWRSGAISRDSMLEALKRGEVLPEGRTVAQERALIHQGPVRY